MSNTTPQAAEAARLAEELRHNVLNVLDPFYVNTAKEGAIHASIDRLRDLASRADSPVGEAAAKRYNFLLGLLIERGVLTQRRYGPETWSLQGIALVDDSGLRGAGRTPEEAIDNAIIAANLNHEAARRAAGLRQSPALPRR